MCEGRCGVSYVRGRGAEGWGVCGCVGVLPASYLRACVWTSVRVWCGGVEACGVKRLCCVGRFPVSLAHSNAIVLRVNVAASLTLRWTFTKLYIAATMRATLTQPEVLKELGRPLIESNDTLKVNTGGEGTLCCKAVKAMLDAVFPGTPPCEVREQLEAYTSKGSHVISQELMDSMWAKMSNYVNSSTELEMPDGSILDLVKLKSGSLTGFAVSAGVYPELGRANHQDFLDIQKVADLLQDMLSKIENGEGDDVVREESRIYRAAAKVFVPDFKSFGTRIIYTGCVVGNLLTKCFGARIFSKSIRAGLSDAGAIDAKLLTNPAL